MTKLSDHLYWRNENAIIFCGDSSVLLPLLPSKYIDLVVTDPPYGINYVSNHRMGGNPFGDIAGDNEYPVETLQFLIENTIRGVLTFCRWDVLPLLPKPKSFIVWAKNNWGMGDLEHEYARQWEAIAWYPGKNHEWADGKRPQDVLACDRVPPDQLRHPTEKPTILLEQLISHHKCEFVLDPFAGSGSTLEAAVRCGKKTIGIELEERYCEIAKQRLLNFQPRLLG